MPGKETADIGLTMQQEMQMEHLEVMDRLTAEISRRTQELRNLNIHFGFLKAAYFLDVNNNSAMKENVNCVTNHCNGFVTESLRTFSLLAANVFCRMKFSEH